MRHGDQGRPENGAGERVGQDAPRPVPWQRQSPSRRAPWWPDPLRSAPGGGADGGDGGAEAARGRADIPESSPAELRELTELSDLLSELAALVHDLSGLIVGLMTAAAGRGEGRERTFTMPSELAELARAHQDLRAEQQALSARFGAARSHRERSALRVSLAALTDRATRAVAAAAAVAAPPEPPAPGAPGQGRPRRGGPDHGREEL